MRSIDALRSDTDRFDITGTTHSPHDILVHSHFRNYEPFGYHQNKCVYYPPAENGFCGVMVSESKLYKEKVTAKTIAFPIASVIGFPLDRNAVSEPIFHKERLSNGDNAPSTGYYIKGNPVGKSEYISAIRMYKRGLEIEKSGNQQRIIFRHNSKNEYGFVNYLFPYMPFVIEQKVYNPATYLYPQTDRDHALINARKVIGKIPEENRETFIKSFDPPPHIQFEASSKITKWIADNNIRWWANGEQICISHEDYTLYKVTTE